MSDIELLHISFARGAWDPEQWQIVRSPRWEAISHWEQHDEYISNHFPDDLRAQDVQMGRNRTGETYISMLFREPICPNVKVSVNCLFETRMAPLIVFAKELGPVHHEHLEAVLYDKGINLWHHFYNDGKPSWKLIAYMDLDLQSGIKYELICELIRGKGKCNFLNMSCNGRTFGCRLADDWPENCYAGFTACEGINRFYDFTISQTEISPVMLERKSD